MDQVSEDNVVLVDIDVDMSTGQVSIRKDGSCIVLDGAEQVEGLGRALAAVFETMDRHNAGRRAREAQS